MIPNTHSTTQLNFKPYYSPYVEFGIVNKKNEIVLENISTIKSMPETIHPGQYVYEDGKRFAVSGHAYGCLAYLIDYTWCLFKQNYDKIGDNKLWIRPFLFRSDKKEYTEEWDSQNGKKVVSCIGVSPISAYNLPHFHTTFDRFPTQEELIKIAKVWNAYVGIPWVLLDRDPLALGRAMIINPAGKFKVLNIKLNSVHKELKSIIFPHISGTAFLSPAILWLTYALGREAISLAMSNTEYAKNLIAKLPADDEISDVINTHSLNGALELWSKNIRNLGINWYNEQYSAAFWQNSLPTFEYIILNGGAFRFGMSPKKNWHLDRPSIDGHCNTLLAWERQVLSLVMNHKSNETTPLTQFNRSQIEETSAKLLEEMGK